MSKIIPIFVLAVLQLLITNVHCDMKPKFYCATTPVYTPTDYYASTTLNYDNSFDDADSTYCVLQDVYLTRKSSGFIPVAQNATEIRFVQVKSYNIKVLTSDICNVFPNLQRLVLNNLAIEEINEDAFKNCSKLDQLELKNNSLVSLNTKTFVNNKNLSSLDLSDNHLVYLDVEMFKELSKLKTFYLKNNNLLDLDVRKLIDYTSLKTLKIGKTHMLCARYYQINKFLTHNYINNDDYSYSYDYCLSSDEYMKEVMSINLSDILLQAKIDYLYKELQKLKFGNNYEYSTEYNYNEGYSTKNTNWENSSEYDWNRNDENSSGFSFDKNGNIVLPMWIIVLTGATAACLLFITLVALISCCKARCQISRQNNQYQHLPE